ncbi:MAG: tetratricopeptide repeat protein [Candidatus Methylomirabilales bacterium]
MRGWSAIVLGGLLLAGSSQSLAAERPKRVNVLMVVAPESGALGEGLADLLGWCLTRAARIHPTRLEILGRASEGAPSPGPAVAEEAEALARRLDQDGLLWMRFGTRGERLVAMASVVDLRRSPARRGHFGPREVRWDQGALLQEGITQRLLMTMSLTLLAPEERRQARACGRPLPGPAALTAFGQGRLAMLRQAPPQIEEAITHYERAGELGVGFALSFYRQGESYEALGSRWKAAGAYRRAIDADPDFAEAYKRLGDLLALSPRRLYDQAAQAYRRAIQVDPDFAEAYLALATVRANEGRAEEAITEYKRGLEVDPWNAQGHYGLARVYYTERGLFHEALAEYQRAISLDPDFAEAYLALGDMQEERGLYRDAIQSYQAVLQIRPKHPGALFAVARAHENVDVVLAVAHWERYLEVAQGLPSEREWIDIARSHLDKLRRLGDPLPAR